MEQLQEIQLFNESKEQLIKVITINKNANIAYIVSTFVNILSRWDKIRIYVYDVNGGGKNGDKI